MKNDNIIVKIDEDTLKVNDTDKLLELLDSLKPTAKDMFKELGYNNYPRFGEQEKNCISFYNLYIGKKIKFRLEIKEVQMWNDHSTYAYLNKKELTAINKQIEELGW